MLRMRARRFFGIEVDDATDKVLFGLSLPSGSIVDRIKINLHFICGSVSGGGNQFDLNEAGMIAFAGYMLPVHDLDESSTVDGLWDRFVPKDTDVDVVDLDTVAQDTTSFFEPGELAMANIFEIGQRPQKWFQHSRILTAVNASIHTLQVISTPADAGKFTPGGSLSVRTRRPMRVSQPSVLTFGVGVPLLDDTSSAAPTVVTEKQWPQLKYMENTLERAILHQMGVVEAGAETPWEEASALLRIHLNPDVYESVATQWILQGEYSVYGEATIDHRVTGRLAVGNVSTGR